MSCIHIYLSWPAVSHTESFTFVVPTVMVFSRYDACNVEICLSSYSPLMYLFDGKEQQLWHRHSLPSKIGRIRYTPEEN
jgi:hypothetical protein